MRPQGAGAKSHAQLKLINQEGLMTRTRTGGECSQNAPAMHFAMSRSEPAVRAGEGRQMRPQGAGAKSHAQLTLINQEMDDENPTGRGCSETVQWTVSQ